MTCRQAGCDEHADAPLGFCRRCRAAYERRAQARERELARLAAQIERDYPLLVDELAPDGEPRALLLAHLAAHRQHDGNRTSGISAAAVRDFLDDAMERVTAEHLR